MLLLGFQTVTQCKVECNLQVRWIFPNATKEVWKISLYVWEILREKVLWAILCTHGTGEMQDLDVPEARNTYSVH